MPTDDGNENRDRLLSSAGRGFRAKGYAALGVDAIAKEVGLTSGSFYVHFKSKSAVFLEALRLGMRDLASGIDHVRMTMGTGWKDGLIDFYLTVRRRCRPDEACALQAMTSDVPRLGTEARRVFDDELRHVVERMTVGAAEPDLRRDRIRALALLSVLSGAVSLARACEDEALADEIIEGARLLADHARDMPVP